MCKTVTERLYPGEGGGGRVCCDGSEEGDELSQKLAEARDPVSNPVDFLGGIETSFWKAEKQEDKPLWKLLHVGWKSLHVCLIGESCYMLVC